MNNDFENNVNEITKLAVRPYRELAEGIKSVEDLLADVEQTYVRVTTTIYRDLSQSTIQEAYAIQQKKYLQKKEGVRIALENIENGVLYNTCRLISYVVTEQLLLAGIDAKIEKDISQGHYFVQTTTPRYDIEGVNDFLTPDFYEMFSTHDKYLQKIIHTVKTNQYDSADIIIDNPLKFFTNYFTRNAEENERSEIMRAKIPKMNESFFDFLEGKQDQLKSADRVLLMDYFKETSIPHLQKCATLFS